MGRRRSAERDTVAVRGSNGAGEDGSGGEDDELFVAGPKVVQHAKKAQKETRRAARAERKLAEVERKAIAKGDLVAEEVGERGIRRTRGAKGNDAKASALTGAKVKRYIGIARIVVPVLAPIVYQAVGSARAAWDQRRARQLGVAPDELAEFSGRGAGLHARVHHLSLAVRDLGRRRDQDADVRAFAAATEGRLADLEAAVRAAEQMPAGRRRSAHVAVAAELERLESRLLTLWGLDGSATGRNDRTDIAGRA